MAVLIVALFIASLIVAAIDLFQSQGKSLPGWAIILTDVGLIIWRLA